MLHHSRVTHSRSMPEIPYGSSVSQNALRYLVTYSQGWAARIISSGPANDRDCTRTVLDRTVAQVRAGKILFVRIVAEWRGKSSHRPLEAAEIGGVGSSVSETL